MILRASLPFKFMRRYINAGHMSNPFTYRNSPIVSEEVIRDETGMTKAQRDGLKRFRTGPLAGALAPMLVLKDVVKGESISLLDCFGKNFVVLYFCESADQGIHALQNMQEKLPNIPVCLYLISPHVPSTQVPESIHVLLDEDGRGATTYKSGPCTLYLVRPDRHIAARRYSCDGQELAEVFRIAVRNALVDVE